MSRTTQTLMMLLALTLVACNGRRASDDDDDAGDDDDSAGDDDDSVVDDDDATDDDDITDDDDATDDDDTTDDDDATPPDPWVATEYMYAHTANQLYSIDPAAPYTATLVSTFHDAEGGEIPNMTDLAVDLTGQMYAVSTNGLWHVAPQTGEVELVFETEDEFFVAATFLSNGALLIGGNGMLYVADVDTASYELATQFNEWSWDGDMVGLPDGLLYCAMRGTGGDENSSLLVYDYVGGQEVWSGDTGVGTLYGIAFGQGILFGFTDAGEVLTISQTTGAAEVVSSPGIAFWGATTNPVRWAEL